MNTMFSASHHTSGVLPCPYTEAVQQGSVCAHRNTDGVDGRERRQHGCMLPAASLEVRRAAAEPPFDNCIRRNSCCHVITSSDR
jgi:hypothetical protein